MITRLFSAALIAPRTHHYLSAINTGSSDRNTNRTVFGGTP
jgi:hypothetical protein